MHRDTAAAGHVEKVAESVFREESGRIIATLIRISGSFDKAEEAMQEAFAAALSAWPEKGIPLSPVAWIIAAAQRKLIDQSRREKTKREKEDSLRYETPSTIQPDEFIEEAMHFPDDRLRLMFTCCHPAINQEAQVALTLRTLGGLTTPEIAQGVSDAGSDVGAEAGAGQAQDPGRGDSLRGAAGARVGGAPGIGAGGDLPDF